MDPLSDLVTTRPIQVGWEITIQPYPHWRFWCIDNLHSQFDNSLVLTQTQTQSGSPEPLLMLSHHHHHCHQHCRYCEILTSPISPLSLATPFQQLYRQRHNHSSVGNSLHIDLSDCQKKPYRLPPGNSPAKVMRIYITGVLNPNNQYNIYWITYNCLYISFFLFSSYFKASTSSQKNVNWSASNLKSSQTFRLTSPVLVNTSRCSQTPLELSKVLADSARAFTDASESTCSYGGAFWMLWDLTYRKWNFVAPETSAQICGSLREKLGPLLSSAGYFESSRDHCTSLRETWCRILTAVVFTYPQGILSFHIRRCYSHQIPFIIIWHALFKSLSINTYGQSGRWWYSSIIEGAPGQAQLGGCCGEMMELEGREAHHQHSATPLTTSKQNSWEREVLVLGV